MKKVILLSVIFISSFEQILAQSSSVEPSKIMTPLLGVGTPTFLTGEKLAVKSGTTQFGIFPGYLDNVANSSWTTLDIPYVNGLRVWDNFSVSNNVGIGTTTINFPLSFASTLGDKISLWGNSGNHFGFGIQPSLLQIHTDVVGSDIAFGYGTSASMTETMRIKGNGNVGIGVTPSEKLEVAGKTKTTNFQMTTGATNNYILKSDATGNASWAVPTGTHTIGESYGGGIVFYVYDNGLHGLIAAPADFSYIQWYNGVYRITGTSGDGLGAGAMNTAMIVATQMADSQAGNFAAKMCADYSVTVNGITYGDWYLPSKYECALLYLNKAIVGGFTTYNYWTSTEAGNYAWTTSFFDGNQNTFGGKDNTNLVRAIRAF